MNSLKKITDNQMIRYIFFGGCTTMVNVVLFFLLRKLLMFPLFWANFIAISTAIVFAFFVNKVIVFESKEKNSKHLSEEFLLFLSMRSISMGVEIIGVWFTVEVLLLPDIYSKLIFQVFTIAFNFYFSKYIVFRKQEFSNNPIDE